MMWGATLGMYVADGRNNVHPADVRTVGRGEFDRKYLEVFGVLPGAVDSPTGDSSNVVSRGGTPGGRPVAKTGESRKNPVASQAIRPPVRDHSRRHGRNSIRRGGQRPSRRSSPKHRSHGRLRRSRHRSVRGISRSASQRGRPRRGFSTQRDRPRHASPARRMAQPRSRGSDRNRRGSPPTTL